MKIGLDFDGVITDCGKLKSLGAKRLYNLDIQPEIFKTELVVGSGILTHSQYRFLQNQIYETELGMQMEIVPGAREYIEQLKKDSNKLYIITSRGKEACDIAQSWMNQNNIILPMHSVGGGISKKKACKGLDVYIDDDYDKLEPLVGVVPNRFLFSWGYNQYINTNEDIAKRVSSWKDFYEKIQGLNSN
ncbi:MAG: hypothetical protein AABW65_01155 [Nanoarchaeota archaeon]